MKHLDSCAKKVVFSFVRGLISSIVSYFFFFDLVGYLSITRAF